MNSTHINEYIKVWAFFDQGIFPIAISWRRRLIKFQKVIFTSNKRTGDTKLIDLVCQAEGATYELEYNTTNQLWKVKKVIS